MDAIYSNNTYTPTRRTTANLVHSTVAFSCDEVDILVDALQDAAYEQNFVTRRDGRADEIEREVEYQTILALVERLLPLQSRVERNPS